MSKPGMFSVKHAKGRRATRRELHPGGILRLMTSTRVQGGRHQVKK